MTLEEAEKAVATHLEKILRNPQVQITIGGRRGGPAWFAPPATTSPAGGTGRAPAPWPNRALPDVLNSFRSSEPAAQPAQGVATGQPPRERTSPEVLSALREHVQFLENHFKKVDALFRSGSRGGSAFGQALAGYELAAAQGELALAESNYADAQARFGEAEKYAEQALVAAQAAHEASIVQDDALLQAAKNLTQIKRRISAVRHSATSADTASSDATTRRDSALTERTSIPFPSSTTESLGVLRKIAYRAKADYDRIVELAENNVVSATEVARAKSDFEISIERVRQAERGLKYYRLLVEAAEADYQSLLEAKKRTPDTVTDGEVRKAKIAVELAEAKLEELSE
jgi:hypothetical protein